MATDSSRPARDHSDSLGTSEEPTDRAIEQIRLALKGLRFGQVTVTVQDGVVVQIDRTEKLRLR